MLIKAVYFFLERDNVVQFRFNRYRFMKVANELPNVGTLAHLGLTALNLIATLPEEERTKEHTTEKGEIKNQMI